MPKSFSVADIDEIAVLARDEYAMLGIRLTKRELEKIPR